MFSSFDGIKWFLARANAQRKTYELCEGHCYYSLEDALAASQKLPSYSGYIWHIPVLADFAFRFPLPMDDYATLIRDNVAVENRVIANACPAFPLNRYFVSVGGVPVAEPDPLRWAHERAKTVMGELLVDLSMFYEFDITTKATEQMHVLMLATSFGGDNPAWLEDERAPLLYRSHLFYESAADVMKFMDSQPIVKPIYYTGWQEARTGHAGLAATIANLGRTRGRDPDETPSLALLIREWDRAFYAYGAWHMSPLEQE